MLSFASAAILFLILSFGFRLPARFAPAKALAQAPAPRPAGQKERQKQPPQEEPAGIVIQDNDFYDNNVSALHIRGSRVLVEKCSIHRNGNAGLVVDNDAQVLVQDNQIYGQEGAGITVMGKGSARASITGNQIYQNTMAGVQLGAQDRLEVAVRESFRKNPSAGFAGKKDNTTGKKVIVARVHNNRIYRNGESGIKCQSEYPNHAVHLTATQNKIFRNQKGGIFLASAATVVLQHNSICDNHKAGVSANELKEISPQVDIYQNVIRGNEEAGLEITAAKCGPVGVCNNLIFNNGGSGIRFKTMPMRIINNTIASNGNLAEGSGIDQQGRGTPLIASNILAYNFKTGLNVARTKGCSYNLLFANGGSGTCCDDCTSSSKAIESKELGGHSRSRGDLICDPMFSNPDLFDYRLKQYSPAIDAGFPSREFHDRHFPPSQGGSSNDLGFTGGPLAVSWDPNDLAP
ncbi:MAG: right-handed parallel beta-helix repeat-containing protein [bacterium]